MSKSKLARNASTKMHLTESFVKELPAVHKRTIFTDTVQTGLSLAAYPSGAKAFFVSCTLHERSLRFRIGPASEISVKQARARARELLSVVHYARTESEPKPSPSLGHLIDLYADVHAEKKSLKRGLETLNRHLPPWWRERLASDITYEEVAILHKEKTARSGPAAANAIVTELRAVYACGIRAKFAITNPCAHVKYNQIEPRRRFLSDSEIASFWRASGSYAGYEGTALRFQLLSAQRTGEVAGMRWEDLPADRCWHVGVADNGQGQVDKLPVYLSDEAWRLIQSIRPREPSGYVFPGGIRFAARMEKAMRMISEIARFSSPVRPMDLRRTAADILSRRGHGGESINRVLRPCSRDLWLFNEGRLPDDYNRSLWQDICDEVLKIVSEADEASL